jgi:hypothetical protein
LPREYQPGDGLTITEGENQDAHTERQRQNRRRRNRRKMGIKPMRTDGFITNIHSRNPFDVIRADVVLARMEKQANRGCGLYYEIYEARLLSMAMIHLAKLPLNDRPAFIGAAAKRGYMVTRQRRRGHRMNATCCCLNWPLITDRNVNRNHPAGEPATITKEIRMSVTEILNTPSMAFYVPSCNTIYAWAAAGRRMGDRIWCENTERRALSIWTQNCCLFPK